MSSKETAFLEPHTSMAVYLPCQKFMRYILLKCISNILRGRAWRRRGRLRVLYMAYLFEYYLCRYFSVGLQSFNCRLKFWFKLDCKIAAGLAKKKSRTVKDIDHALSGEPLHNKIVRRIGKRLFQISLRITRSDHLWNNNVRIIIQRWCCYADLTVGFVLFAETKVMNVHHFNNLAFSMQFGQSLLFDFSLTEDMRVRDLHNLVEQFKGCHSVNKIVS